MKSKATPPAPIPEYIKVGEQTWRVADLMPKPKKRLPVQPGRIVSYELLPPYTKWPVGYSKFNGVRTLRTRRFNHEEYQASLILSPTTDRRTICVKVPFIAIKGCLNIFEGEGNCWTFWFRTKLELELAKAQSPQGQWLAQGVPEKS